MNPGVRLLLVEAVYPSLGSAHDQLTVILLCFFDVLERACAHPLEPHCADVLWVVGHLQQLAVGHDIPRAERGAQQLELSDMGRSDKRNTCTIRLVEDVLVEQVEQLGVAVVSGDGDAGLVQVDCGGVHLVLSLLCFDG